jgi:hypothetical protein
VIASDLADPDAHDRATGEPGRNGPHPTTVRESTRSATRPAQLIVTTAGSAKAIIRPALANVPAPEASTHRTKPTRSMASNMAKTPRAISNIQASDGNPRIGDSIRVGFPRAGPTGPNRTHHDI